MYTRRQRARNIANRRNVQLKVSCSQEMDVLKILTIRVSTRYRFKFEYCTFVKVDRLRKNICPRPTEGASRGSEWLGLHVYVYVFKYSEYVQTSNSLSAAVLSRREFTAYDPTRRDATKPSCRVWSGTRALWVMGINNHMLGLWLTSPAGCLRRKPKISSTSPLRSLGRITNLLLHVRLPTYIGGWLARAR